MPTYAIVNKTTGEFDADCIYCGLASISGHAIDDADIAAFESAPRDQDHILVEITNEEKYELIKHEFTVVRDGKEYKTFDPGELDYLEREVTTSTPVFKIDPGKAKGKIGDREKAEVPIEIDGPNGKEIIGYEQRPVSIIVERSKLEKEPGG